MSVARMWRETARNGADEPESGDVTQRNPGADRVVIVKSIVHALHGDKARATIRGRHPLADGVCRESIGLNADASAESLVARSWHRKRCVYTERTNTAKTYMLVVQEATL
jgi:hypothetical protein